RAPAVPALRHVVAERRGRRAVPLGDVERMVLLLAVGDARERDQREQWQGARFDHGRFRSLRREPQAICPTRAAATRTVARPRLPRGAVAAREKSRVTAPGSLYSAGSARPWGYEEAT